MKKIVLCGGGTAGHILPCLALIPELKKRFDEIYYFGSKDGMEYELVQKENIPFFHVDSIKFSRTNLLSNIKIPFILPKCIKKCEKLLSQLKPDVIFSKGGYVSLPVTESARKLSIPYVIHESDATLGLANKVASRGAKLILTNFPNTHKGEIVVGIPLRNNLYCNKDKSVLLNSYGLENKKTILVLGGSLGSKTINDNLYKILDLLIKQYNVIHITGKNNPSIIKIKNYLPITFTSDIGKLYLVADIVVSRSGATCIAELQSLGKKVILIPLSKKASRGDQLINAKIITDINQNFSMILENELTPQILYNQILSVDKKELIKYENNNKSNAEIVDLILSCCSE